MRAFYLVLIVALSLALAVSEKKTRVDKSEGSVKQCEKGDENCQASREEESETVSEKYKEKADDKGAKSKAKPQEGASGHSKPTKPPKSTGSASQMKVLTDQIMMYLKSVFNITFLSEYLSGFLGEDGLVRQLVERFLGQGTASLLFDNDNIFNLVKTFMSNSLEGLFELLHDIVTWLLSFLEGTNLESIASLLPLLAGQLGHFDLGSILNSQK